jgi:hypothetical protein
MDPKPTDQPQATARSQRSFIVPVILAVIVIASAVLIWHAHQRSTAPVTATTASSTPDYATLTSQLETIKNPTKVFNIVIDETKQISGPTTIRVKLHDSVRVNVRPGGAEEVNAGCDGLGLYTESAPEDDTPGGFSFVADKVGTFPYFTASEPDAHGSSSKVTLGKIIISN